ncbi:hypothetical protein ACQY0O_002494 [Thecaphora frezii]
MKLPRPLSLAVALLAILPSLHATASPPVCPGRHPDHPRSPHTRKVAIIGAGPSGSSASYFLKTARDRLRSTHNTTTDSIHVTIFERDNRVGGRTAVAYPYDDQAFEPVELGASLYAAVNYNMRRAVKQFGLETGAQNGVEGETGVWDGQQFLFRGDISSWWTSAKLFLRYGNSPLNAEKLLKKALSSFLRLYNTRFLHHPGSEANRTASGFPWTSIRDLAHAVDVRQPASITAADFFTSNGVSTLFVEEMIEALTRVNYAQDTTDIHGFGGLISLALSGAQGVRDGNFRLFEEFVRRSGARLRLGEEGTVTGLVKFDSLRDAVASGKITCREALSWGWMGEEAEEAKWWVGTRDGEGEMFDAVIVAAPWHDADITLLNTDRRVAKPPYVHLYVTVLTTTAKTPNPEYFGFGRGDEVPRTILTSDESVRRAGTEGRGGQMGFKAPHLEFLSLNYLRPLRSRNATLSPPPSARSNEHVVKIFSLAPISDDLLSRLFGHQDTALGWVHRKTWFSYPFLTPMTRFPRIEVDENLYFSNAFESLASTMETSIVAARNTVGLVLRKWYGEEFVNGGEGEECPWSEGEGEDEVGGDKWEEEVLGNQEWAGWGCRSG